MGYDEEGHYPGPGSPGWSSAFVSGPPDVDVLQVREGSLPVLARVATSPLPAMADNEATTMEPEDQEASAVDPIWTSSRTARQIYMLGEVEKVSHKR
jgi:hypothetical protein